MNCKSCNTRIPGGASNCPNCGLVCSGSASKSEDSTKPGQLSPSTAQEEIDLDEIATPVSPKKAKTKAKVKAAPAPAPSDSGSGFAGSPKPSEIRAMLTEQLGALEAGLGVFTRKGRPPGENFETDVGVIDLLASDDSGGLVVIMMADPSAKDVVTDMLARIGWVRKHVCEDGQEVRGFVISESMPEGAEYTAAAVADTITFKTYQFSLTFRDLEV